MYKTKYPHLAQPLKLGHSGITLKNRINSAPQWNFMATYVTVVDMLPAQAFAKDAAPSPYTMLHALMKKNNVKLVGNAKVLSISDEGVEIIDRDLNHAYLEADTVCVLFSTEYRGRAVTSYRYR